MSGWFITILPFLLASVSGQMPPVFESNMTTVELKENFPVGHIAFRLVAHDADNDTLSYGMEGSNSYHFSVNKITGYVTLVVPLDYEAQRSFRVTITVDDGRLAKVTKSMTVIVLNCNDNAPVFQNTPYVAEILENSTVGSSLFHVSALDVDDPKLALAFTITEVIPRSEENRNLFYITREGNVILNGTLSYNGYSTFYQLKINASDNGEPQNCYSIIQSSITYLSFNIIDVPDLAPQFINVQDLVTVMENSALGTSVLTVSAIDGDKGVNDKILYHIGYASVPGLFAINNSTGEIFVSGLIDRETLLESNEQVLLTIVAQESNLNIYGQVADARMNLTVRVIDVNDNKPQFYNCELPNCNFSASPKSNFVGEVEEHSSSRVPVANLSITAYDPDKDFNGAFELFLQGPDAAAFSVSPHKVVGSGTVQILVSNSSAVDYEVMKVMTVQIVANDSALGTDCCSFANVTIHLLDINDHSPQFAESFYKLQVEEHCKNGTVLSTITATDKDSGVYGEISYWLLPESILNVFTVNSSTGEISVRNGDLLDRETGAVYYATLQALDGMGQPGTTFLEINILDINDNAPVILGSYNVFVNENSGTVQLKILASDKDEFNTNNSIVEFEIMPNQFSRNFSIGQESGLLTNTIQLDREAINETLNGKIVLLVRAYDLGTPQLDSFINVTITVEDLNDNEPVFSSERYQFSVKERERGVFIGSVYATDRDQTEVNNRMSFQISNGSSGNFLIRSSVIQAGHSQGQIWLVPEVELDYETQKNFSLVIEVQDTGINNVIHQAYTTVTVLVKDVNDEPPTIDPSLQEASVLENKTQDNLLTTVVASDKDTNHSLIFETLFVKCFQGTRDVGSVCSDWFRLLPNGSVLITEPLFIDYETCDLVEIKLQVVDLFTEMGRNHSDPGTLQIHILDINDNAPEFLSTEDVFVLLSDPLKIQPEPKVKVTDIDTGQNGEVKFSITHVEFIFQNNDNKSLTDIFSVMTTHENKVYTGSISLVKVPDLSNGGYRVTVEATDGGNPALSAQKNLDIFAVEKSYEVRLEFSLTVSEVQQNLDAILKLLKTATKANVYEQGIKPVADTKAFPRALVKCFMLAYFIFSNGTAIRSEELTTILLKDGEALSELNHLGLYLVASGNRDSQSPNKEMELIGIVAGLTAALVLSIVIMIVALVCIRKSFQRRLKALKALKKAKTVREDTLQHAPNIPGTNKYNMEGANPVLNLSPVPIIDREFEEQPSDTASLNSLDENSIGYLVEKGYIPSAVQMNTDVKFLVLEGAQQDFIKFKEPLTAALQDHKNIFQDSEEATSSLNTTDL
ncbi:cadherin-related family member 2 [Microcaecilia unicolor]|uniref:Cadherin-related family member 2 n=1 Tax=Microcaecilia unicolor TaxID=1415580 RepID=A0A6P7YWR6_9AMPH|nr:cadherin-related family member 2 [Microcaecilia unicolor]